MEQKMRIDNISEKHTLCAPLSSSNSFRNMIYDKNGVFKKGGHKVLFGIILPIVLVVPLIVYFALPGSDEDYVALPVSDEDHHANGLMVISGPTPPPPLPGSDDYTEASSSDSDHASNSSIFPANNSDEGQVAKRHMEIFSLNPPPSLTTCGSTINAEQQGEISYKFKQPYEAGELCTFIIRHHHPSIHFKLIAHGISDTDRNAIGVFSFNDKDKIGLRDGAYFGPPNDINVRYFNGDVVVVIFTTIGNSGTGFLMSFTPFGERKVGVLPGMDLVVSSETASPLALPLPSSHTLEKHCDLLVINDGSHVIPDTIPKSFVNLVVSQNFSQPQFCYDYLMIFNWERGNLRFDWKYCGNKWDKTNYRTQGLLIFLYYKSNQTSSGYATLNWKRAGPKPKPMDLPGIDH